MDVASRESELKKESDLRIGHVIDVSVDEVRDFKDLVLQDDQVDPEGLLERVRKSHFLGMLFLDGDLGAVGAIKNNPEYQKAISKKSCYPLEASRFLGEVGYLHTAKKHRGQGYSKQLLNGLLSKSGDKATFAAIRNSNHSSRKLFEKSGFKEVGHPWPSTIIKDEVTLFVSEEFD